MLSRARVTRNSNLLGVSTISTLDNANGKLNCENRTLFNGDNLEMLRGMNSNSVNLIATDPPFNKG